MPGGLHPPPEVTASWPKPNYVDPERHDQALLIICFLFGALAFLAFLVRVLISFILYRKARIDEWILIAAMIPTMGLVVIGISSVNIYGFDLHTWDSPPKGLLAQRKLIFISEILYEVSGALIKCSILCSYLRIVPRTVFRGFIIIVNCTIASVVFAVIILLATFVTGCAPLNAFWDQVDITKTENGFNYTCQNEFAYWMASGAVSCAQNLVITTLPIPLLWYLQPNTRQKLGLSLVFSIGYLICGISGVRVFFLYRVFQVTYDVSWEFWYVWIFMVLEILVGVITTSAPVLKVFCISHDEEDLRLNSQGCTSRLSRLVRLSLPETRRWVENRTSGLATTSKEATESRVGLDPYKGQQYIEPPEPPVRMTLSEALRERELKENPMSTALIRPGSTQSHNHTSSSSSYFILD